MLQQDFNLNFKNYQTAVVAGRLSESQRFGLLVEKWVVGEINQLSHTAHLASDYFANYDIAIDSGLKVEVKASRPYPQYTGRQWRDRWQFKLTGGLDYLKEDFVYVLVVVDRDGVLHPYVVPSAHIGSRSTVCLTSHPLRYSGWLKSYLNAWHFIDIVNAWRRRTAGLAGQLSLFDEVTQ